MSRDVARGMERVPMHLRGSVGPPEDLPLAYVESPIVNFVRIHARLPAAKCALLKY